MDTRGTFFREIHKNTWLKRLSAEGKKFTIGNKKSERNWVVFCVHNDTEALLEGYCEPRSAASHNPDWVIPLQSTQHISHSLVPNEQEYEFVITLNDEIVRFHTFSWEIMQEWVSTLRSKLRELRILSPKENLYTKLPEVRFPLLPTRDPTSPLPATPLVPPVNVPGVEHVSPIANGLQRESVQASGSSSCNIRASSDHRPLQLEHFENREESVEHPIIQNNEENPISTNHDFLQNNSALSLRLSSKNLDSALIACGENSVKVDITLANKNTSEDIQISDIFPTSKHTRSNIGESTIASTNPICNKNEMESEGITQNNAASMLRDTLDEVITNITIIQVSNSFLVDEPVSSQSGSNIPSEFKSNIEIVPSELKPIPEVLNNNQSSCRSHVKKSNMPTSLNEVTTVHIPGFLLTNSYGSVCPPQSSKLVKNDDKIILSTSLSGITNISIGNEYTEENNEQNTAIALNPSISIANNKKKSISSIKSAPSNMLIPISQCINTRFEEEKYIEASTSNKCPRGTANTSSSHGLAMPSTSSGLVADEAKKSNNINQLKLDQCKKIVGSPKKSKPNFTRGLSEAVISARPSRIDQKNLKSRTHNSPIPTSTKFDPLQHRRCSSTSVSNTQSNEAEDFDGKQLTTSQTRTAKESTGQPIKPLTLREQQVLFLKREIMHPGGIRLQLRRKDCLGSIAWVDAFGGIWIAGWKQKEHPMLYNALHIGDQLISIGQSIVTSADEANKIIRNSNTLFLEILIRRVPFGRIYAIRRETEGQCLGLIRDGNTATIVDVVPNSLAARHGLPPRVKSCDGLCLAFWVLTEINGRPLNLFFKENEVRDRLNSVGRDISILVQPSDLILKLKKQLKSLRSYKDYIVQ